MLAPESVVLETSLGKIQLELYGIMHLEYVLGVPFQESRPPFIEPLENFQTCENVAQLVQRGYYNGVIFHRIVAVRPDTGLELSDVVLIGYAGEGPQASCIMVQGGDPTGSHGQGWHEHMRSNVVRSLGLSLARRVVCCNADQFLFLFLP
jgi:Cyclophilin type peptidyl-prolyl cis-trans isomerase/CLD